MQLRFYRQHELEELGERFQQLKRIRMGRTYRGFTFANYLTRPEHYDKIFTRRLRDWADNPRLVAWKWPIILN